MKLFLACLVFSTAAWAEVTITFKQIGTTACPLPERIVMPNGDGTYSRPEITQVPAIACFKHSEWREVWTDLPEKGGKFIRIETGEKR